MDEKDVTPTGDEMDGMGVKMPAEEGQEPSMPKPMPEMPTEEETPEA